MVMVMTVIKALDMIAMRTTPLGVTATLVVVPVGAPPEINVHDFG